MNIDKRQIEEVIIDNKSYRELYHNNFYFKNIVNYLQYETLTTHDLIQLLSELCINLDKKYKLIEKEIIKSPANLQIVEVTKKAKINEENQYIGIGIAYDYNKSSITTNRTKSIECPKCRKENHILYGNRYVCQCGFEGRTYEQHR